MQIPRYLPLSQLVFIIMALGGPASLEDVVESMNAGTAEYVVTFESTWSASTHPAGFPPNPHFSGLIGATHDSTIAFWTPGEPASDGIERMAETGSKFSLTGAVGTAMDFGQAEHLLSGGGIGVSPGSVTLNFEISEAYPLVTLVSMLAPSPDWFVGVRGLNLREGNAWAAEVVVHLFVYDAGTDSGTSYTSPDDDTQPADDIFKIETAPFLINDTVEPVGTFTFTLVSVIDVEKSRPIRDWKYSIGNVYPNPVSTQGQFVITTLTPDPLCVEMFDIRGRLIQTIFDGSLPPATRQTFTFEAGDLPDGLYFLRFSGYTFSYVKKVVIAR